jgi:hypothetical protein
MYKVNSKIQTIAKRLPLMAAILGAGLAMAHSYVPHSHQSSMLAFEYDPPGGSDYSSSAVTNVANWNYTPDEESCSNDNVKACKIYVPNNSTYIGSSNTLKSAIGIVTGGTSTQAYVDHTAAGSGDSYVSNRLN